jgi:hypothetical protein
MAACVGFEYEHVDATIGRSLGLCATPSEALLKSFEQSDAIVVSDGVGTAVAAELLA